MTDIVDSPQLAPLDELVAILPTIERAKERARLGTALQKATASAEQYEAFPDILLDLGTLLSAVTFDKEYLRGELSLSLAAIAKMGQILAGEPSVEELDGINQAGMAQLPLQLDKIAGRVEDIWRRSVQSDLGGQAALGKVLSDIPGVEALGRDLKAIAARAHALANLQMDAAKRVTERDALLTEASALQDRLLEAGIAEPIADFLVSVTANPVRLSDLTDEIFEWIRSHDALDLFSVSTHGG